VAANRGSSTFETLGEKIRARQQQPNASLSQKQDNIMVVVDGEKKMIECLEVRVDDEKCSQGEDRKCEMSTN
jgi:hypothetical protein